METKLNTNRYSSMRDIPSVSVLLSSKEGKELMNRFPVSLTTDILRECLDDLRSRIGDLDDTKSASHVDFDIWSVAESKLSKSYSTRPLRIINGTGIVLHTNMGRAPLHASAYEAIGESLTAYSDLELDINTGKRGSRQSHVFDIITRVTGAEAVYVVNNNAAAVLLCLDTFSKGKEVIVSRGELVEVGGAFRIPDVMAKSGARLVEVGSTNKTRLADYQRALTDETGMLMKVHTSNFKIVGFTDSVSLEDMVALAKENNVNAMYDMGSGLMVEPSALGINASCEGTVKWAISTGADIVVFSGDKLLGGPQAGIIIGTKSCIEKIAGNPLARALRVDKMTLSALLATFKLYLDEETAINSIPVLKMIKERPELLKERGEAIKAKAEEMSRRHILETKPGKQQETCFDIRVIEEPSEIGGGTMPDVVIEGFCIVISSKVSAETIQSNLRKSNVPVIGYIVEDEVHIHMRTIFDEDIDIVAKSIVESVLNPCTRTLEGI